jgi:hypothetical protein
LNIQAVYLDIQVQIGCKKREVSMELTRKLSQASMLSIAQKSGSLSVLFAASHTAPIMLPGLQ